MQFIIMLVIMLIMDLTRPVPKAPKRPGLGDYTAPTAEQDRPIPKFWGKPWLASPNLVWYGDLRLKKITVKNKGMFTSKKQTIGYETHIGLHMIFGIGNEDCRLLKIVVGGTQSANGGDVVWTGSLGLGNSRIDKPDLWGGKESGGGMWGSFTFMPGGRSQGQNSYLRSQLGSKIPAYRGVCGISWNGGYHGTQTVLQNWAAQIENLPRKLSLAVYNIGGEANPAEIQYDLLTANAEGMGLTADMIDVSSFQAAAVKLHAEGLGISLIWDNAKSIEDMLKEVDRHVDAVTYFSQVTKTWRMRLIRKDYQTDLLRKVTPKNAKMIKFNRPSADELVNEMIVTYSSDEYLGKTLPVRNQDTAAYQNQNNQRVTSTQAYPGFTTLDNAKKACSRDFRALSYPFAAMQLELSSREFYDVEPVDRLVLDWEFPDGKIENMPIIVLERGVGTTVDGRIPITAVQDTFGLGEAIYTEGGNSGWTPINREALAPTNYRMEFTPWWMLKVDPEIPSPTSAVPMLMVESPSAGHLSYTPRYNDPSMGNSFMEGDEPQPFTPTATLVYDYLETVGDDGSGTLIVSSFNGVGDVPTATVEDLRNLGSGMFLIDNELMGCNSAVERDDGSWALTSVKRGLLDTTVSRHLAGAKVWFISEGLGRTPTELNPFASGTYRAQLVTQALGGSLPLSQAPMLSLTTNGSSQGARPLYPNPVRNLRINNSPLPGKTPSNSIPVSWYTSNKELEATVFFQNDTPLAKPGDTYYIATLHDDFGVQKATSGMIFSGSHTFAVGDVPGGLPQSGYVQVAHFNGVGAGSRATLWFGREVDYANTQDAAPQRFLDEAGPWTFIRMAD